MPTPLVALVVSAVLLPGPVLAGVSSPAELRLRVEDAGKPLRERLAAIADLGAAGASAELLSAARVTSHRPSDEDKARDIVAEEAAQAAVRAMAPDGRLEPESLAREALAGSQLPAAAVERVLSSARAVVRARQARRDGQAERVGALRP